MPRVTKICAQQNKARNLRVAAYCRISTMMDGQLTSIKAQRDHYTSKITNHSGWDLVDIYLEEGVTGTKKEIRPELNRLLRDCKAGKIDMILTKSISRFSRNVTDCLEMVRTLTGMGVRIIFEKENVDTERMGTEFLLTVMSSIAEEESHSISGNAKWAVEKRFESGTFQYSNVVYGYTVEKGVFHPNPSDAAIVRWIFDEILSGVGMPTIAHKLNAAGTPSPEGGKWSHRTIGRIVKNPALVGDLLMKQNYTDDHFRIRRNFGEKPMYYMENHHEGIIDRETFDLAQKLISQRTKESGNAEACKNRHLNPEGMRYVFTGKIVCGSCGSPFQRDKRQYASGERIFWHCNHRKQTGLRCTLPPVMDEEVKNAFLSMINKLRYADFLLDAYIDDVHRGEAEKNKKKVDEIQKKLKMNADERNRLTSLFQTGNVKPVFYWEKMVNLQGEASNLKTERFRLSEDRQEESESAEAVAFQNSIQAIDSTVLPTDDDWEGGKIGSLFETYVEKVIVRSKTRFTFVFTFGLELTEETDADAKWEIPKACLLPSGEEENIKEKHIQEEKESA